MLAFGLISRAPLRTVTMLAFALLLHAERLGAAEVTLSANVVGVTPQRVGYNSGHFMPGSNTASWWKYSGVNAARVWSTPDTVEGADDNGVWGDGVGSLPQFLARRTALRADPNNPSFINWPYLENRYATLPTSSNTVNLAYAFGALQDLGAESVVEIHRSVGAYPLGTAGTPAGWAGRWEQWQHFYAQAFYLAKNFDVARFQMYNEPNHRSNIALSQAEYIERLQFASDAVQSAIADVNAIYGKSLDAQMHGPVTAGANTLYKPNLGGTDTRDDLVGWGERVIDNLHTNFQGQVDPNFKLIDTYAYQQYSGNASTWTNNHSALRNFVNADAPGEGIRFAVTEMNVSTAGDFEDTPDTLETPFRYARMGSILAAMAKQQVDELYVFKFSQTINNDPESVSGVKKNGVHYVDNNGGPYYNVGGSTKAAEVVRLFARDFAGSQQLLQTPAASGNGAPDLQLAAVHNAAAGRYSLISSNLAAGETGERTLNLNLNDWNLTPGTWITVEEVSSESHGEVRRLVQVPASGLLPPIDQPAESVLLVSAPDAAPAYRVTLGATDDAMVKSGSNAASNFGTSANLFAKNDPLNPAARNVSFIKFDMGDVGAAAVEQAILRVHGENDGSDATVITHVYGLLGDDWDEETITWNNAPNLRDSLGVVNNISHNFIEGIGTSADIVGHFTGTQTARELMLDVTPFVQAHPDEQITFLIAREVRFNANDVANADDVDDALTSLKLESKDSLTDVGPQLILSLNGSALPADFNGDGTVDGEDLDAWKTGLGMSGVALKSNGDADGDRDVDGSDFLQWQRALGSQLIPSATATASAIPEPSGAALAACVGWCLLLARRLRCSRGL